MSAQGLSSRTEELVRAAMTAATDEAVGESERAEMLMELAMGLQQRPKTPDQLIASVMLYDRALEVCPADQMLLRARIIARKGTALQAIPEEGHGCAEQARAAFETALPDLARLGLPQEAAEAQMNLGLALQHLAGLGRARLTDAITAYQRALGAFDRLRFPVEYAILQNNLATAFLAIPLSDERAKMREALAVQCFEDGLKAVTLIDHPAEYAMLQNNLGNALQYVSSAHSVENNLRALDAYDEALKVRSRENMPLEYANTLANRANCLWNLPDDPQSESGINLFKARTDYQQAFEIFTLHGETDKCRLLAQALAGIERDIQTLASVN